MRINSRSRILALLLALVFSAASQGASVRFGLPNAEADSAVSSGSSCSEHSAHGAAPESGQESHKSEDGGHHQGGHKKCFSCCCCYTASTQRVLFALLRLPDAAPRSGFISYLSPVKADFKSQYFIENLSVRSPPAVC
ncbi:MAG: hypothetical protein ACT4NX_08450 [Deltaproteobacteria bacterium]